MPLERDDILGMLSVPDPEAVERLEREYLSDAPPPGPRPLFGRTVHVSRAVAAANAAGVSDGLLVSTPRGYSTPRVDADQMFAPRAGSLAGTTAPVHKSVATASMGAGMFAPVVRDVAMPAGVNRTERARDEFVAIVSRLQRRGTALAVRSTMLDDVATGCSPLDVEARYVFWRAELQRPLARKLDRTVTTLDGWRGRIHLAGMPSPNARSVEEVETSLAKRKLSVDNITLLARDPASDQSAASFADPDAWRYTIRLANKAYATLPDKVLDALDATVRHVVAPDDNRVRVGDRWAPAMPPRRFKRARTDAAGPGGYHPQHVVTTTATPNGTLSLSGPTLSAPPHSKRDA